MNKKEVLREKIPQSELRIIYTPGETMLCQLISYLYFLYMNTRESVSTEIQTPRSWNRESYQTPDLMLCREFDQFFAKKFPFYRNQYLHPRKLKVLEGFQTS